MAALTLAKKDCLSPITVHWVHIGVRVTLLLTLGMPKERRQSTGAHNAPRGEPPWLDYCIR